MTAAISHGPSFAQSLRNEPIRQEIADALQVEEEAQYQNHEQIP